MAWPELGFLGFPALAFDCMAAFALLSVLATEQVLA
jgi:hypothetical protein